ncbi:hypothetical protein BGZ83_002753 [Gryganskiella cystojenkinii]|nr:hypothetical protein BGZ83_002753 [Gryganskiella cystojenkinii]
MLVDAFDKIDPTKADHVHIILNPFFSVYHTKAGKFAQYLGKKDKCYSLQLDLYHGFDRTCNNNVCENTERRSALIQSLYTTLLDALVTHVWPAGLHPVVWIVFDNLEDWGLLDELLSTIRTDLTDLTLDVAVERITRYKDPHQVGFLCKKFRVVACTIEEAFYRVADHAERPDFSSCRMTTRWSKAINVTSLPFYEKDAPWYVLTNFAQDLAFTCIDSMRRYETTEHYFQANKCSNIQDLEKVKNAPTPREAFQAAKESSSLCWYWETQCRCGLIFKEEVMFKALLLKFSLDQGPSNRRARYELLSTGNCQLVEQSWRDPYWGTGQDGKGMNRLGYLLERVRRVLFKEEFQIRGKSFDQLYQEEEV